MAGEWPVGVAELDAAGITDPHLRESYRRCRLLHAAHGRTYYLATKLLPAGKRPFVYALYGFARYADEIVDDLGSTADDAAKAAALDDLQAQLHAGLEAGSSPHPVVAATVDTALRWKMPREHFDAFMHSMRMDLTVTSYATYDDLLEYVYGSAAVIGLQMLPILEPEPSQVDLAAAAARDLGWPSSWRTSSVTSTRTWIAAGSHLPLEELADHAVSPEVLQRRFATPPVKGRAGGAGGARAAVGSGVPAGHRGAPPVGAPVHRRRPRALLRHHRCRGRHRLRRLRHPGPGETAAPTPGGATRLAGGPARASALRPRHHPRLKPGSGDRCHRHRRPRGIGPDSAEPAPYRRPGIGLPLRPATPCVNPQGQREAAPS